MFSCEHAKMIHMYIRRNVVALAVALLLVGTAQSAKAAPFARADVAEPTAHVLASTNWSGYAVTGKFTGIKGTFTVPQTSKTDYGVVAEWVGIDGFANKDLIQCGVTETGGITQAWWEILPGFSVPITWMKISAGDQVEVSVRWEGTDQWSVVILDKATLQTFHQVFTYNGPARSAEWVVEAPSSIAGIDQMAKYGETSWSALTFLGNAHNMWSMWLVQGAKVVSIPSAVPNLTSLVANGFSVEYVG